MRNIMLFFCMIVTFFLNAADSSALTLFENGKINTVIVLEKKSSRSAQFAAYELQHFLKLVTGKDFPIRDTPKEGRINIYIGSNTEKFEGEEYEVKTIDNNIYLRGHDEPDFGIVDYQDTRTFPKTKYYFKSTEYAVYDFLEKACGIRFYSYGDNGVTYEKKIL